MARPKGSTKDGLKYLKEEEVKAFLDVVRRSKSAKYAVLFELTLYLGLRAQEAVNIKLQDLNLESDEVTIRGVKSGRVRTYVLPDRLVRKVKRYLKARGEDGNPFLFPSQWYKRDVPVTTQSVKKAFKKYAAAAKLNGGLSIHSLRHTTAMLRVKAGAHPVAVMKWLRHRSITSTQVYFEQVELEEDGERAKEDFAKFL